MSLANLSPCTQRVCSVHTTLDRRAPDAALRPQTRAPLQKPDPCPQGTDTARRLPQRRNESTMIIVNADAVEATAATLSAAEALEALAPAAASLTGAEAAALRAMCAAVATRDATKAQRLSSKRPPAPPPRTQTGSAVSELEAFLEQADLGRYADALVAAGCASVQRLRAASAEELKNLKDPRNGGRVLAVGALARLRRLLNGQESTTPAPVVSPQPEHALTGHLADLGLERFAPALARAGVATVAQLLSVDPKDLRNLVDPQTGQKVLAVGPYSKLRASLEKLRERAPAVVVSTPTSNDGLATFLEGAGLGRVAEALKRCGISTLQQLRDTPPATLKAAVDPQTGTKVLAVGPLSKLRAALREQDDVQVPAGIVFACSDGDAAAECLDRRLFAFPQTHVSIVKAILATPDRGASIRIFLWDAHAKRLHGIFRPDSREGDSADTPVDAGAFTSAPWTGVGPQGTAARTKFPVQLRVTPVRAFEPLPATLAGSVLAFERPGCAGAPAYDLTAEQVAHVSRLFMTRGA